MSLIYILSTKMTDIFQQLLFTLWLINLSIYFFLNEPRSFCINISSDDLLTFVSYYQNVLLTVSVTLLHIKSSINVIRTSNTHIVFRSKTSQYQLDAIFQTLVARFSNHTKIIIIIIIFICVWRICNWNATEMQVLWNI